MIIMFPTVLLVLLLIIYFFRLELFGFRVCEAPNLLDIKEISQENDGSNYTINISGDTMSSALFFRKHKYEVEDKTLKIGLLYTPFKSFSTGKSNFSIKINLNGKINKVIFTDNENIKEHEITQR